MSAPRFFAVIGAQRSGTTWAYRMLDAHPAITMAVPMRPEPKFFLDPAAVALGPAHYRAKHFPGVAADQVLGEKGTSYIEHPAAAPRIRAFFPEARAIAILRNPVHRALSNYHFTRQHGLEPRTLEEVFLHDVPRPTLEKAVSVPPFDYLERGRYVRYLEPWRAEFGADLRVEVFEELVGSVEALQRLYAWLGVDASFIPPDAASTVNARDVEGTGTVDPAVLSRLARYFAPHIAELEGWLGRRIDPWHDPLQ